MLNYYDILQVPEDANEEAIKEAFKVLAKTKHPDKAKAEDRVKREEEFKIINDAYQTLSDPVKRRRYDDARKIFLLTEEEEVVFPRPGATTNWKPAGYITNKKPPYSALYRQQHAIFVSDYQPLGFYEIFDSKIFNDNTGKEFVEFILAIRRREHTAAAPTRAFEKEKLTPLLAINLLNDFLQGKYTANEVSELLPILRKKLNPLQEAAVKSLDIVFYEGVIEVLQSCTDQTTPDSLLKAIGKITDFATFLAQESALDAVLYLNQLTVIFASKRYRKMFAFALHQYWTNKSDILSTDYLKTFDGTDLAKRLVDKFKEEYLSEQKEHQLHLVKISNLIRKQEKLNSKFPSSDEKDKSQFYREKGYLLLDWVLTYSALAEPIIIYNTFLQAAVCFQKASQEERLPAFSMADEKLAFDLYKTVYSLAKKTNPAVELHINTILLKYLSQMRFCIDENFKKILSHIEHRTLFIADIYPFYTPFQSNAKLLADEGKSICLLRQFLHNLMKVYDANPNENKIFDHEYVNILYQVYEACLQNWYEINLRPDVEEAFRYRLMQELLRVNRWTFSDVNRLLMPPHSITVTRDAKAWIAPTRTLSLGASLDNNFFNSVDAIEIDFDRGQIGIYCTPYKQHIDPEYKKLITSNDLTEIFNSRTTSASFSLDQVDPDRPYHPFNKVRFAPSNLYGSQLMHCMLLADYLLKFLTVGKEVQADNPFALRGVEELLKPLPLHLRKIIEDFQTSQQSAEINRFWIEAEELPVALGQQGRGDKLRMAFNNLKMIVRKHAMKHNSRGEWVDQEKDIEGWDMFVGTIPHKPNSDKPTMYWDENSKTVRFYQNGEWTKPIALKESSYLVNRLLNAKRDDSGKILISDSQTEYLVYSLTTKLSEQTGIDCHFSAEYRFAQEFSHYYDEFAIYFPELGRLRELSKVVMVTRLISSQHLENQNRLSQARNTLSDDENWDNIKRCNLEKVKNKVREKLSAIIQESEYNDFSDQVTTQLASIKSQIGTIYYTTDSPEIRNHANEAYRRAESEITRQHGYSAWCQVSSRIWNDIQNDMAEAARKSTDNKLNRSLEQLREIFALPFKNHSYSQITTILTDYLNGYSHDLHQILLDFKKDDLIRQLGNGIYKKHSSSTIRAAIDGYDYAIQSIANSILDDEISDLKSKIRNEIDRETRLYEAFSELGLSPSLTFHRFLDDLCLWIPASINHEKNSSQIRRVYGGVQVAGRVNQLNNSNPALNSCTLNSVDKGTKVFRVYGGGSGPYGQSWTTVDPRTVANYRDKAGLPNCNTGRFVIEGILRNTAGVGPCPGGARPLDGNKGGLFEVCIPKAKYQVQVTRVSGCNPEY